MAFLPNISNYKPFYYQKSGTGTATDTRVYGMVAKTNPFPVLPEPKEPYTNDWPDQNGDDEYVTKRFYKSFEFTVSFYMKAYESYEGAKDAAKVLAGQIQGFFDDVKFGTFKTYDAYTGIGYSKVRYSNYGEEEFISRSDGKWARSIFTITFKVLDPLARATLAPGLGTPTLIDVVEEEDE